MHDHSHDHHRHDHRGHDHHGHDHHGHHHHHHHDEVGSARVVQLSPSYARFGVLMRLALAAATAGIIWTVIMLVTR